MSEYKTSYNLLNLVEAAFESESWLHLPEYVRLGEDYGNKEQIIEDTAREILKGETAELEFKHWNYDSWLMMGYQRDLDGYISVEGTLVQPFDGRMRQEFEASEVRKLDAELDSISESTPTWSIEFSDRFDLPAHLYLEKPVRPSKIEQGMEETAHVAKKIVDSYCEELPLREEA